MGRIAGDKPGGGMNVRLEGANVVMRKVVSGSQFATVGALGLVVNQAFLWFLVDVLNIQNILLAAAIATQGSTTFNFVGTESWVFGSRREGGPVGLLKRFVAYDAVNSTALIVRLPLLQFLTMGAPHMNYLIANLITLVLLTLVRFVVADNLIWSNRFFPRRLS
jgi:dolichol-phosphate mannosyltransferase